MLVADQLLAVGVSAVEVPLNLCGPGIRALVQLLLAPEACYGYLVSSRAAVRWLTSDAVGASCLGRFSKYRSGCPLVLWTARPTC
jgi:hypothetical protein